MKKYFICFFIIVALVSCNKTQTKTCAVTIAGLAGNYKISKFETIASATGLVQDQTASLDSCTISGIYRLKIDGNATYSQSGQCNDNAVGDWGIENLTFHCNFNKSIGNSINLTSITSWDCSNLVLTTMFPASIVNYRYTLTKP